MPVQNVLEAVQTTLATEMRRDPRIVVLGEDVGRLGGVFQATAGLYNEFGSERVIDTPLAEAGVVGIAVGAAFAGAVVVVEIQFADFIHSAIDHIINEAARLRYRTNGGYGCPLVIRAPYGVTPKGGGGLYHSQSVEGIFLGTPGLKIAVPSTPADAKGLLTTAIRDPDPVLFLEHKATYRGVKGEVPEGEHTVPFGQAAVRRAGGDISVITYGMMVHHALAAAEVLAGEGVDVEVLDLRTLQPLDREAMVNTVRKTGKALVAHEDCLTGGAGGEIAAILGETCFDYLDAPVVRLAAADVPLAPFHHLLEEAVVPGKERLIGAMRQLAAY